MNHEIRFDISVFNSSDSFVFFCFEQKQIETVITYTKDALTKELDDFICPTEVTVYRLKARG